MKSDDNNSIDIEDTIRKKEEMVLDEEKIFPNDSVVLNNEIEIASAPTQSKIAETTEMLTGDNYKSMTFDFDDDNDDENGDNLDVIKEELNQAGNSKRVRFSTQIQSTVFYEIQKQHAHNKEKSGKFRSAYNRVKNVKAIRVLLNKFKRSRC